MREYSTPRGCHLFERFAIGLLAVAAERFAVAALFDDRLRLGLPRQWSAAPSMRERHKRQRKAPPQFDRQPFQGAQRYLTVPPTAPSSASASREALRPKRRRCRRSRPRVRPRPCARAAPGRRRARLSAAASATGVPGWHDDPLRPSCTSPPAAAPTASLAITGSPRFMASFTTSPQARGRCASESTAPPKHRRRHRSCAIAAGRPGAKHTTAPPAGTQGGVDPAPTRTSAAVGACRPDMLQASTSTPSPFSRAGRPANKNFTSAFCRPSGIVRQCSHRASSRMRCPPTAARRERVCAPLRAHVGADVRAIGDDGVGRAVQAP